MAPLASIVVHGGAGQLAESEAEAHFAGCRAAARIGADVLRAGGSALDAVVAAVAALEDDPLFNAGTGAAPNRAGEVELDAALMDGEALRYGGVAALPPFANPIRIARAVLDDGEHILLAGEGAAAFARERGFAPSSSQALVRRRARASTGTVGAVALDAAGHLAAATSTGGTANKRVGRVGDSPLPGCGTYADDRRAAVSCTGPGEPIARVLLARATAERVAAGADPDSAARAALAELAERTGARAGLIVLDRAGRFAALHTTPAMSWARATQADAPE